MIPPARVQVLNRGALHRGRYVLYWVQAAPRTILNHALEYAIRRANELGIPLLACFVLSGAFPRANNRHYAFLIEGLRDLASSLNDLGVLLVVRPGDPEAVIGELGRDAALVVVDRGYVRVQARWYAAVAAKLTCPMVQVETNVVVPLAAVSSKEEYAARTIRPRIERLLDGYLLPLSRSMPSTPSLGLDVEGLDLTKTKQLIDDLGVASLATSPCFVGGESEAERRLRRFVETDLHGYAERRNDPSLDASSRLSPYLHFGQLSPVEVALRVRRAAAPDDVAAFLEQLIVRRELACNFVAHNAHYDAYESVPEWARRTLDEHAHDPREYLYDDETLESALTHDPYWNAAQSQMVVIGWMHGYMRMYWGKKIIEWSASPRIAFERLVRFNDKYELDGRDPNGYAGIAWCFGNHDRPWRTRSVFGSVRYMNANGLRRKFDIDSYVRQVANETQGVDSGSGETV